MGQKHHESELGSSPPYHAATTIGFCKNLFRLGKNNRPDHIRTFIETRDPRACRVLSSELFRALFHPFDGARDEHRVSIFINVQAAVANALLQGSVSRQERRNPRFHEFSRVIIDNLPAHKGVAVEKAMKTARARLALSAEILTRSQSNRTGLQQIENASAQGCRANDAGSEN